MVMLQNALGLCILQLFNYSAFEEETFEAFDICLFAERV